MAITKIKRTNDEWRKLLTPEQFQVGVKEGTERPFTPGSHDDEKRPGVFHCVGCDTPLWSMDHKFNSGTGWPSFFQPINDEVVEVKTDFKLVYPRKECHCTTCGLHMGHVFKDGPPPTGQRWCINGVVLNFVPSEA